MDVHTEAHTEKGESDHEYSVLHPCQSNHFVFQHLYKNAGVKEPTLRLLPLKSRVEKKFEALQLIPAFSKLVSPGRIHFSHEDCDISGESSICNCWNIVCSDCTCFKHQKTKAYFLCSYFSLLYEGMKVPNAVELFSVSISCLSHFLPHLFFSI